MAEEKTYNATLAIVKKVQRDDKSGNPFFELSCAQEGRDGTITYRVWSRNAEVFEATRPIKEGQVVEVEVLEQPRERGGAFREFTKILSVKDAAEFQGNYDERQRRISAQWAIGQANMRVANMADCPWETYMELVEQDAIEFLAMRDRLLSRNVPPGSSERPSSVPAGGKTRPATYGRFSSKEAFANAVSQEWPDFELATIPDVLGCSWAQWVIDHNEDILWASSEAWKRIEAWVKVHSQPVDS